MIKEKPLKTIKVLPSSIKNLNFISAVTGEKQYEVLERISKVALQRELKTKRVKSITTNNIKQ